MAGHNERRGRIAAAAMCTAIACAGAGAADAIATADRYRLDNGIRVVQVHAPEATVQTVFTFLPLTLANDDAHRAQWSHLLEHMLVRSTDPEGLDIDGIRINGETMHSGMRVESIAPAARWREALERHPRWLAARRFDAASLEREKGMIAGEEAGTAMVGATAKFALAAWSQVVVHGLSHAAVHGDVANATLDDVHAYADARVPVDDTILVATIGPAPPDELRAVIVASLGSLAPDPARPASPAALRPGALSATWDLPDRHVMLWWRLPDATPAGRATASVGGQLAMMAIHSEATALEHARRAMLFPVVETPGGLVAVADVTIDDEADPDEIARAIRQRLALVLAPERREIVRRTAMQHAMMLTATPDFAAAARGVPESYREYVPTQWLLTRLVQLHDLGAPDEATAAATLRSIERADVDRFAEVLGGEPAGRVVLEPVPAGDS